MSHYSFDDRLAYTRGVREQTDIEMIKAMLPGCQTVEKTPPSEDRNGVDYVATLRRGATVLIDAKTRDAGASRWWNGEPDIALEIWSVMPGGRYQIPRNQSKVGWTLSEHSNVDLILYTFSPQDSDLAYLLSFQLLRCAFIHNFARWKSRYKIGRQDSSQWESQAIFVPVSVVLGAITDACCQKVARDRQDHAQAWTHGHMIHEL